MIKLIAFSNVQSLQAGYQCWIMIKLIACIININIRVYQMDTFINWFVVPFSLV